MMRKVGLIATLFLLSGCAMFGHNGERKAEPKVEPRVERKETGFVQRFSLSRQLSSAVGLIRKGDTASARRILSEICTAPPAAGVTDEALFRLALLSLKPATEKEGVSLRLLRRLKREFPESPWSYQSQPLLEFVGGNDELRRQHRSLKGANQGLAKENQGLAKENEELKKSIDQMKHLDLELEKKNR
jgi:hypothetical protein